MRYSRRRALTGGFPPPRICPVKVRTWRCGSDGLEHPPVTRETAGSNPVISAAIRHRLVPVRVRIVPIRPIGSDAGLWSRRLRFESLIGNAFQHCRSQNLPV